MIRFVPLTSVAPDDVDALLDAAFGTDRIQRTAYRVRAGTAAIAALSEAVVDAEGSLIASIQCWPVQIRCDSGETVPMVMVGPVAVAPDLQRGGIGRRLMERLLERVERRPRPEFQRLMLVGDPEYYGRFFGFTADRTGAWRLPGPVERHRLLARGADVPDCAGIVEARLTALVDPPGV